MSKRLPSIETYAQRHLVFGWTCLFCFILIGLVLDYFHAFKVAWYLNVGNESRRLMGTLAHAHGTLLGGLNIVYALMLDRRMERTTSKHQITSPCLISASLLIPLGFLAAGVFSLEGQPGFAVFLVPIGGILLLVSIGLIALEVAGTPNAPGTAEKRK